MTFPSALKKALKKKLRQGNPPLSLNTKEDKILERIRSKTREQNVNNVTRTQAYLDFYLKNPELHWAFLAHLVSRNAGWNMTDLKGEFIPKLLTGKEQVDFFVFLERGNWLIFQDAYPQLLLYEESKAQRKPLFHLLPALNVSSFMEPNWQYYWNHKQKDIMAVALIINEQNYIEERVIHNQQYKQNVLDTLSFKLQDLFDMNQILFPYFTPVQQQPKVIGDTVHHFSSLHDRIATGKILYQLLYSVESRLESITKWAKVTPHTGSRSDYWPHIFHDVKETIPGSAHRPQARPCAAEGKTPRIYSPRLLNVWENWVHPKAEGGDWFKDLKAIHYFKKSLKHHKGDIIDNYCETIEKLELAAFTKKVFYKRKD
ncbi:DUF2515 family protein [Halobacillus sp. BBL2006]|uniref:DUF2515 family protein n=1 Tax=Halobacillus sp. BBL2006 TaxID=1543706 RepID=UPI000543059B|nr:DUF2515 family protein [Halobacillus sp. BBL2006]KHE72181.1 hypothetical protein LD39_05905 [Halobacillus sp. BBL2006]